MNRAGVNYNQGSFARMFTSRRENKNEINLSKIKGKKPIYYSTRCS